MNASRLVPFAFAATLPVFLLGGTCGPTSTVDAETLRFVLVARTAGRGPLYVQASPSDDQPGWIRLSRADGQRVYLRPRCEIPDCLKPSVVCGMAVPTVRDIFTKGSVEFEWDGSESVLDPASGCQTRRSAPAGSYVASFCYARQATTTGEGNPEVAVQGVLVAPVCKDVPFQLPTSGEVRFQVASSS